MKCETFEDRLNDLLDQRLPFDEAIHAHAQACPACQNLLSGYQALCASLPLLAIPCAALSPDPDAMQAAPRSLQFQRAEVWQRATLIAASLAALLLLAVASPSLLHSSTPLAAAPAVLEPQAVEPLPADLASAPQIALEEPLSDEELQAELNQLLAQLQEQWESEDWTDPALVTDFEADQLPDGFRPIAKSFGVAFTMLRGTIPGAKRTVPALAKPPAVAPVLFAPLV